jgi:site-specific recombinase
MAISALLARLDANANLVERHLWLVDAVNWIRGSEQSIPDAVARVEFLVHQLESDPDLLHRFQSCWRQLLGSLDGATLLAGYDIAANYTFLSELIDRFNRKWLPSSPETEDVAELFRLVFHDPFDARWIAAMPEPILQRLGHLLSIPNAHCDDPDAAQGTTVWQTLLLDAITFCTSQIRSAGLSADLRLRMEQTARKQNPFLRLDTDCDAVRRAWLSQTETPSLQATVQDFCKQLDACRHAAHSVYAHLEEHGISTNLVFRLRQLRERILRVRTLLDCLLHEKSQQHTARLIAQLAQATLQQKSIGALISSNSSLLAAKIAERSAETGEHYITRNRTEYRTMLRQAAGGGALTSITTALKFAVFAVGFSAFWSGFWVGLMYAASFIAIQLLHFTLATKQPAMTAPAMTAKLKEMSNPSDIQAFVDEVTHLVRSQVAAVVGNVTLVFPVTIALSWAIFALAGHHMIQESSAHHVLSSLHLLGPTLIYAAFTGVLLFSSSIIAGWVENFFVLHRLDSALRYNPRITQLLGPARAARWAQFMRLNISGFAANLSLGLLLGLAPAILSFIGPTLDVRHVTLSAGQLGAATASIGLDIFFLPAFWWACASIPFIAVFNVGVSFYLAFRVALLAHNVSILDRARIRQAIFARLRASPSTFFWPAKEV